MYSKIIFFIATLYVVNASVITIKAYDDTVVANAGNRLMPPRCTDRICGLFCDLVGFENGTCLNGQCKCIPKQGTSTAATDTDHTEQVMKEEAKDMFIEQAESYMDRKEYSIMDSIFEKCNQICDRVCHFLQFENGTCVSGRCKCTRKDSSTTDEADADTFEDTNLITEQEENK